MQTIHRHALIALALALLGGCGSSNSDELVHPFGKQSAKGGETPMATYRLSLRYSQEGNLEALYDLYDSEAHGFYETLAERSRMNSGFDYFRRQMGPMLRKMQSVRGMQSANATADLREEISGDHAVIRTGIHSEYGSFNADVELVRENGVWKLRLPQIYRDTLAQIQKSRQRMQKQIPGITPGRGSKQRSAQRQQNARPKPEPPAFPKGDVVFLDDLKESHTRLHPFHRKIGKHGATGFKAGKTQKCRVNGVVQDHALMLNGWSSRTVAVEYQLDGRFRTFQSLVGLIKPVAGDGLKDAVRHRWKGKAGSPITFRVIGDGRILWESPPVQQSDEWLNCEVNIEGVKTLRLSMKCKHSHAFAWCTWAQPRVSGRIGG